MKITTSAKDVTITITDDKGEIILDYKSAIEVFSVDMSKLTDAAAALISNIAKHSQRIQAL